MKHKYQRTYRSHRPLKIVLTILTTLILAAVILTAALFFGLKQYIVYDEQGILHLEIPWLEEDSPS